MKKGIQNVSKLKFSKISSRVNCIINTVSVTVNTVTNLNLAFKEEVINEIKFIEDIEGNELLEQSLLENKIFYS